MPKRMYLSETTNVEKRRRAPKAMQKRRIMTLARRYGLDTEVKESHSYIPLTLTGNVDVSSCNVVTLIAQGTENTQRVGRKCKHHSVAFNLYASCSSAAGIAGFWAIVLDRQVNGALAAITDVFDTSSGAPTPLSWKNTILYADRFKILRMVPFTVGSPSLGGSPFLCRDWVDLRNLPGLDQTINFNGTGNTVGDINHGAILLCYCINSMNGNNMTGVATANIKYRFTDV